MPTRVFIDHGFVYLPVRDSISNIEYDGIVYNLEVDKSNSYTIADATVHNCSFYVEGQYCTRLHSIINPEFTCDLFKPTQNIDEVEKWAEVSHQEYESQEKNEMSLLQKFQQHLNKSKNADKDYPENFTWPDWVKNEPKRRERLKEFQKFIGFPDGGDSNPTERIDDTDEIHSTPWTVNESGKITDKKKK